MKYVAPVAEVVDVETVSIMVTSTCPTDCIWEIDGCPDNWE